MGLRAVALIAALICNHSLKYPSSFIHSFASMKMVSKRVATRPTIQPPPPPSNTENMTTRRRRRRSCSCSPPTSVKRSSTKTHHLMSAAAAASTSSYSTTTSLLLHHLMLLILLLNQNNNIITPANAHGYFSSPRSRNYVAYQDRMWSEEDAAGSLTPVPWPEDCKFVVLLIALRLCVHTETFFVIS
jgi:hypothetical protein